MRVIDFGDRDTVRGIAHLDDGGLVLAGTVSSSGNSNFGVARLDSSGNLVDGFGTGGQVTFDNAGASEGAWDVMVDDGRFIVGGYTRADDTDFMVVRFLLDGSLDTSFGSNGSVVSDFAGVDENMYVMDLQEDGKIVAAGSSGGFGEEQSFIVARYSADGALDDSFGSNGSVTTAIGNGRQSVAALTLGVFERITAVGYAEGGDGLLDVVIARYWQ